MTDEILLKKFFIYIRIRVLQLWDLSGRDKSQLNTRIIFFQNKG